MLSYPYEARRKHGAVGPNVKDSAQEPHLSPQEPQREQLQALLDNIYGDFVSTVAAARGKTQAEAEAMLDEGIYGASDEPGF